jgi:hypothetical protein
MIALEWQASMLDSGSDCNLPCTFFTISHNLGLKILKHSAEENCL